MQGFIFGNIRKALFWENIRIFFRADYFKKKYKKLFREIFWGLRPESALERCIVYYSSCRSCSFFDITVRFGKCPNKCSHCSRISTFRNCLTQFKPMHWPILGVCKWNIGLNYCKTMHQLMVNWLNFNEKAVQWKRR